MHLRTAPTVSAATPRAGPSTSSGKVRAIAGVPAERVAVPVGDVSVALYTVADLERIVDRDAVLRGAQEPPYWAYLWAGARTLAAYVRRWVATRGARVLEIGCGLGLPGVVAGIGGGSVVFVDTAPEALAFAGASAAANGVRCDRIRADAHLLALRGRFDLVLAAEMAYERAAFGALADTLTRHLAPGGTALLADAFRIDTRSFYEELQRAGLTARALDLRCEEEGRAGRVRLTSLLPAPDQPAVAANDSASTTFS